MTPTTLPGERPHPAGPGTSHDSSQGRGWVRYGPRGDIVLPSGSTLGDSTRGTPVTDVGVEDESPRSRAERPICGGRRAGVVGWTETEDPEDRGDPQTPAVRFSRLGGPRTVRASPTPVVTSTPTSTSTAVSLPTRTGPACGPGTTPGLNPRLVSLPPTPTPDSSPRVLPASQGCRGLTGWSGCSLVFGVSGKRRS